jgi:predicted transcriptional regulator
MGRLEKTLHIVEHGAGAQLVDLVASQPGISQREIARALGIRESSVKWHLDRLEDQAVVKVTRGPEGKRVRLTQEYEGARLASFERVAPAPAPAQGPVVELVPVDGSTESVPA